MPTTDCFHCHKPGHWANECPLKTTTVAAAFPPVIHCPCNGGACVVLTSFTKKNPNRRFYKCSAVPNCGFFKWCDQVKIKSEPVSVHPTCSCGSGPCRRVTVIDGPNAHRSYFVCCIKKGFGACGFFQWEDNPQILPEFEVGLDDSPSSTLIGFSSADDENFQSETDLNSNGIVASNEFDVSTSVDEVAQPVTDHSDTYSMKPVNIGVLASADGLNQVTKDVARVEGKEQMLPSVSLKHVDPQVEAFCSAYPRESYALDVVEATCGLQAISLSQNIIDPFLNSTDIHQSGKTGTSWIDLIKQYNSEKLHFEKVSMKHVDALTAFTSSRKQLEEFRDRAHNLRKQLLELEIQVKLSEAETSELATSLQNVCGEMVISQRKMVETAGKVASEVQVYRQRNFTAP